MAENNLNLKYTKTIEKDENNSYFGLRLCCSLFLIFLFTIYINIFRPIASIMNIIFCFTTNFDNIEEDQQKLFEYIKLTGIAIFFLFRFFPFFYRFNIIRVISLTKTTYRKFFYIFYFLFECLIEMPIPYLYESPGHSLFLLHEKGIGEILNPSIIFFPTEHLLSLYTLLTSFITSIFFIFSPIIIILSQNIKETTKEANGDTDVFNIDNLESSMGFMTAFYVMGIIINIFCLIFLIIICFYKCLVINKNLKKEKEQKEIKILKGMRSNEAVNVIKDLVEDKIKEKDIKKD